MRRQTYPSLDVMRIVAMYFVVFNHTALHGFARFTLQPVGSAAFWVDLFLSVFSKFAVPLFWAVSGALLLSRPDEPLGRIWRKRIPRIAVALVLMSFLFYLLDVAYGRQPFDIGRFARTLYASNWNASYWYLYAYLGYLITLPMLRSMVKNLDDKYFYYMFALALIFKGVLLNLEHLLGNGRIALNASLNVSWIAAQTVVYPCLGYFLLHRFKAGLTGKRLLALWGVNILAICVTCLTTYRQILITGVCNERLSQGYHESLALVNCATMFLTIRYFMAKRELPAFVGKLVGSMSDCVWGIFLIHLALMTFIPQTESVWALLVDTWHINGMVAAYLVSFVVMMVSYAAVWLLRKIPLVKWLF